MGLAGGRFCRDGCWLGGCHAVQAGRSVRPARHCGPMGVPCAAGWVHTPTSRGKSAMAGAARVSDCRKVSAPRCVRSHLGRYKAAGSRNAASNAGLIGSPGQNASRFAQAPEPLQTMWETAYPCLVSGQTRGGPSFSPPRACRAIGHKSPRHTLSGQAGCPLAPPRWARTGGASRTVVQVWPAAGGTLRAASIAAAFPQPAGAGPLASCGPRNGKVTAPPSITFPAHAQALGQGHGGWRGRLFFFFCRANRICKLLCHLWAQFGIAVHGILTNNPGLRRHGAPRWQVG